MNSSTAIPSVGRFSKRYLLGETDGQPKDAAWAAAITGVAADTIVALRAPSSRTPRVDHGLAFAATRRTWRAAGLDGGCCSQRRWGRSACRAVATPTRSGRSPYYGRRTNAVPMPTLSQGRNAVSEFIPVARIADMLLDPGGVVSLQRQDQNLSRYPPGLLGRRQSVPSSPGSQSPAARFRCCGYVGGA
mgnify:CR=1 FL=1